jgi:hypothetical protein
MEDYCIVVLWKPKDTNPNRMKIHWLNMDRLLKDNSPNL